MTPPPGDVRDDAKRKRRVSARRFSGAKLREVRESQGLNQRDLAKLSGVSYAFISQLETKGNVPTVDRAFALADALKVHIFAITTRRP